MRKASVKEKHGFLITCAACMTEVEDLLDIGRGYVKKDRVTKTHQRINRPVHVTNPVSPGDSQDVYTSPAPGEVTC